MVEGDEGLVYVYAKAGSILVKRANKAMKKTSWKSKAPTGLEPCPVCCAKAIPAFAPKDYGRHKVKPLRQFAFCHISFP